MQVPLPLKDKRNKPFDALRFVSDMTGTAVELAANNHFAITIPNEQVGVIIPNTRPDGAKILHPTCVIPAEQSGVPIRLKNTTSPMNGRMWWRC